MAEIVTITGLDDLKSRLGQEVGSSDWHLITQEQVNLFADATGDHQWIHVDPERAKEGPFGGPIAHGYLTLSLAPVLLASFLRVEGVTFGLNYGCNKVRFPSPVKVGAKIMVKAVVASYEEVSGGAQVALDLTFVAEGEVKPVCVAQVVYRYYV